jgi:putative transposase
LLVPQDIECSCCAAEVGAPGGEEGARRGLERRGQVPRRDAVKEFESTYGAKFPRAVAKITDDVEQLLAFYDFPAEHWIHLRTTNPIESTFATVRNRSKFTKGPGSRAAGIAMAYKLIEAAQSRWRAVNAPRLVALVRAGAKFENGKPVEGPDDTTATTEEAA